jgi:DNA-binding response OmpR family regulator
VGVRVLIDRPGVAAALAARGIGAGDAVLVVPAEALGEWRHAGAALLAVAADAAAEAAALDDGDAADAVAVGAPDALIASRAARLLRARGVVAVGPLVLDPVARAGWRDGRALALLPREYALLAHLARRAGRTVPHAELHRAVFGLRFAPGTNVLAVQVSRLRARLDRGAPFAMLRTDRARGYRLVAAPDPPG